MHGCPSTHQSDAYSNETRAENVLSTDAEEALNKNQRPLMIKTLSEAVTGSTRQHNTGRTGLSHSERHAERSKAESFFFEIWNKVKTFLLSACIPQYGKS